MFLEITNWYILNAPSEEKGRPKKKSLWLFCRELWLTDMKRLLSQATDLFFLLHCKEQEVPPGPALHT